MVCSARPPLALKPGHSSTVQASGTSGRTILAVTVDNWLILGRCNALQPHGYATHAERIAIGDAGEAGQALASSNRRSDDQHCGEGQLWRHRIGRIINRR